MVPTNCIKTNSLERIKTALASAVVVVFMKGTPMKPLDGFQERAIKILEDQKVRYTYFDVMVDPDIREIVKEYSRHSAYPMIFINQEFKGGLHMLDEAMQKGGVTSIIPSTEILLPMQEKIR